MIKVLSDNLYFVICKCFNAHESVSFNLTMKVSGDLLVKMKMAISNDWSQMIQRHISYQF